MKAIYTKNNYLQTDVTIGENWLFTGYCTSFVYQREMTVGKDDEQDKTSYVILSPLNKDINFTLYTCVRFNNWKKTDFLSYTNLWARDGFQRISKLFCPQRVWKTVAPFSWFIWSEEYRALWPGEKKPYAKSDWSSDISDKKVCLPPVKQIFI